MWLVNILFICRHYDSYMYPTYVTGYCSCVVTMIQLYVPYNMWVVIILFMCRHYDTVICSVMLCEWLLYCSCVVTMIQLYVA